MNKDCMNLLCSCSLEIEDTSHYPLQCHHFYHQRIDYMSSVKSIYDNFESMSDNNKKLGFHMMTLVLMKTKLNLLYYK